MGHISGDFWSRRAENKSVDMFFRVEFDFRVRFCVAARKSAKNDEKPIAGVGTWEVGVGHGVGVGDGFL